MVLVVMVVVVLVLVVCHRDRCAVRTFLWTGFSLSASSVLSCCVSQGVLCC